MDKHSSIQAPVVSSSSPLLSRIIWSVLVLVLLGIASAFVWNWYKEVGRSSQRALPVLGQLPEFELIERSGKPFGSKNLQGNVWIADFIFTRCGGPCPMMTLGMARLQDTFKGVRGVKLVSFSADPEYDTPSVLTEYAEQYHADKDQWLFLTGKAATIQSLARAGFKLSIEKKNEPSTPQDAIIHSTRFILIDRQGRIRGYYDYADSESSSRMASDVTVLLKEVYDHSGK